MSDENAASPPGYEPAARRDRSVDPSTLVALYAVTMAAGATIFLTLGMNGAPWVALLPFPWWLLVASFFAAEATALHIEIRRESHSLSLSGIPLLLGILAVNPLVLVATRLVGSGLALVFVRRRRGLKLVWNLSLYALEAAAAALIATLALHDGTLGTAADWLYLLLALLTAEALSLTAVPLVIMIVEARIRLELYAQIIRSQLIVLVSSTFAVVAMAAVIDEHWLAPLAAVPLFGLSMLLRMHGRLGKEHHDLQQLHQFTNAIAGRDSIDAGLEQLAWILRSSQAAFAVELADGQFSIRIYENEQYRDAVLTTIDVVDIASDSARVNEGSSPSKAKSLMHALDAAHGLVAVLGDHSGGRGFLLVSNRLGTTEDFSDDEVALFTSLTATLGARLSADRLLDQLETAAREDSLTGLANRTALESELARRLSSPTNGSGAVLLLDLDRFKDVNDSLGHQFGDELLRSFAQRLATHLSGTDVAARLGGDEFAVIVQDVPGQTIDAQVARLVAALNAPLELDGITLELGSSVGLSRWPTDATSSSELLRLADIAMYEAKRTHQQWVAYQPTIDHANAHRLSLMGQLRDAMADHQLEVHLQPQVTTTNLELAGAEALLRWRHPEQGLVPPGEFLGLAEQSSLAGALTQYVIERALEAAAQLRDVAGAMTMSVNLTSRDLLDKNLPQAIDRSLAAAGIGPDQLCLEVTEGSLIVDIDTAIAHLQALRDLGCRVSIDDFGTGFASLQYLQRLPIDEVKIDQSFIADMTSSSSSRSIVHSTNRLLQDLGLEVVAEGVEDLATLELLRDVGCDLIQGYYISRPLEVDAFAIWARDHQHGDTSIDHAFVASLEQPKA